MKKIIQNQEICCIKIQNSLSHLKTSKGFKIVTVLIVTFLLYKHFYRWLDNNQTIFKEEIKTENASSSTAHISELVQSIASSISKSLPSLTPNTAICPNTTIQTRNYVFKLLTSENRTKHHPSMFKTVIEPSIVCGAVYKNSEQRIEILAYVFTRNDDHKRRDLIRHTWADHAQFPTLIAIFPVGLSSDPKVNEQVRNESLKYGDLLQGDFAETYNNLTFKSIMSWQWMHKRCDFSNTTGIRTIMKVDDDVVINTPFLLGNISRLRSKEFLGRVIRDSPIVRDLGSPYLMSFEDFPWKRDVYEPYCTGAWFLFSSDLVALLYRVSELNMGFRHDDVYVGMVASCVTLTWTDRRDLQCEGFNDKMDNVKSYLAVIYLNKFESFKQVWSVIK
jgi:hypothetical protein